MADFDKPSTISVTCPRGLTPFLQEELQNAGFRTKNIRETGLELTGSLNDCIRLNFWLRTAHRVHYLIDETTRAANPDSLYKWLTKIPWENYIPSDGYFSVTSRIDHPSIDNTQFANLRVKDAIVDRFRSIEGRRPDSGSDISRNVVFLYWDRSVARIFADTSGESLNRRGYRTESVTAPLQESLASAILQASRWEPGQHLINPMCGSGTIAIEAALIAKNRPPASLRHDFGFMHIPGYNEEAYNRIRAEARTESVKETEGMIIASDRDERAISAAKKNAITAGVDRQIKFEICDYDRTPVPGGDGVVIINPPYGERLDEDGRLGSLYKGIGNFLKNSCPGKTGYVLTGSSGLAKRIGLRTSQRIPLYNSTIECRLLEYELYRGSGKS
ncbi:MAG: class I SAM-dependent RNA methyltransferase [Balneolaceae bacterium]